MRRTILELHLTTGERHTLFIDRLIYFKETGRGCEVYWSDGGGYTPYSLVFKETYEDIQRLLEEAQSGVLNHLEGGSAK